MNMKKKKHLVVICGQHYPVPSPTATCAERYALLFKDEFVIDLISESENGDEEDVELSSGIFAHTLSCRRRSIENKSKGFVSKMMHLWGTGLLFTNLLGNQRWYRKAACKKLEAINQSYPIDIIFAICSPLAAIWAGIDYKKRHPYVKLCSYTVDPYSTPDRIKPFFCSRRAMLGYERKALSSVDRCLLSEEVYNTREDIRIGLSRYSALPYLMPPFVEYNSSTEQEVTGNSTSHRIRCIYAGSFYDKIRNPEYMLNAFSQLSKRTVELHLYSKGCDSIVAKYANGVSIIEHGLVPQNELQRIYREADVLIGVGNSVADFLPSKTFEYISQRKPIIYFNHKDLDNEVLKVYPCALQLSDTDPIDYSIGQLLDFLSNMPSPLVDSDKLMLLYQKHSPESIKRILDNSFNDNE